MTDILLKNILKSKQLSEQQIEVLFDSGIRSKQDLATVGDAQTLADISGIPMDTAVSVMQWATGSTGRSEAPAQAPSQVPGAPIVIDSADIVTCVHCHAKQPKDYKSGDLCPQCGKQAEPSNTCYWCSSNGPGKFCRQCGAQFVPIGELELAVLLRREGNAKDEIAQKLLAMSQADKDRLWERARRS